jgi:ferritin-like protein
MGSESYHEPLELIPEETRNMHRAIVSLIEELEAVDWYGQRAGAASDPELKAVLLHHRNEEIEHAMMNLEWIRRNDASVDEHMRTYLFAKGPITQIEENATGKNGGGETAPRAESLGIGSLKGGG